MSSNPLTKILLKPNPVATGTANVIRSRQLAEVLVKTFALACEDSAKPMSLTRIAPTYATVCTVAVPLAVPLSAINEFPNSITLGEPSM